MSVAGSRVKPGTGSLGAGEERWGPGASLPPRGGGREWGAGRWKGDPGASRPRCPSRGPGSSPGRGLSGPGRSVGDRALPSPLVGEGEGGGRSVEGGPWRQPSAMSGARSRVGPGTGSFGAGEERWGPGASCPPRGGGRGLGGGRWKGRTLAAVRPRCPARGPGSSPGRGLSGPGMSVGDRALPSPLVGEGEGGGRSVEGGPWRQPSALSVARSRVKPGTGSLGAGEARWGPGASRPPRGGGRGLGGGRWKGRTLAAARPRCPARGPGSGPGRGLSGPGRSVGDRVLPSPLVGEGEGWGAVGGRAGPWRQPVRGDRREVPGRARVGPGAARPLA
jgi:hypothetical protein